MTKFDIAITGSYPKALQLGKIISRYRTGKTNEEILQKAIEREEEKYFKLVNSIGVKYSSDGLFRWDDVVDVTFSYIEGAEKGDLMRFFDNNFYYRRPIIKKKIKPNSNEFLKYIKDDQRLLDKLGIKAGLSVVILGPLSYHNLSENKVYDSLELLSDYANVVNSVVKSIGNQVKILEIHEPSISDKLVKKDILERLPSIYDEMLKGVNIPSLLLTYFELNTSRLEYLFKLPVTYYGIDVAENKNKLGIIYRYFDGKKVFLGVINTRNTRMDSISSMRLILRKAKDKGAEEILVGNPGPMDFIPEVVA
ncbi:hypothetical protein HLB03_06660, partial [Acidianus sp. DSM 29099]|nr:hypothetical protein [Acidianus sp. RZ1]